MTPKKLYVTLHRTAVHGRARCNSTWLFLSIRGCPPYPDGLTEYPAPLNLAAARGLGIAIADRCDDGFKRARSRHPQLHRIVHHSAWLRAVVSRHRKRMPTLLDRSGAIELAIAGERRANQMVARDCTGNPTAQKRTG